MERQLFDKICRFLEPKLKESSFDELKAMLEEDMSESDLDVASKGANDAALRGYGSSAVRSVAAFNAALRKTRHILGDNPGMALDSAPAVYGAALRRMGVDLGGSDPSSYEFIFDNAGKFAQRRLTPETHRKAEQEHPQAAARLSRVAQL